MGRNITVIPAKTSNTNLAEKLEPKKIRMAAYCRVSTDQAEQLSSYEAQVNYYTAYINSQDEYEMAGIYADEGISATNTKKRDQFNKMIDDCKAGHIDMIITKSISRFARNTLDCLNFVRLLKDLKIGVIFEKEYINTLDSKGEVLLSILSSLAQDESRSISENSQWGIRRRFEQGKLHVNHTKFVGYDKNAEGNLIINEEQAKIIRRIYNEYLSGNGPNRIAKGLERDNIKNWNGNVKWYESSIRKILSNEKYKGDALLQKTYTVDYLSKKRAVNNGEVSQYYVENSHPAIIDHDTWEAVQLEMVRRSDFAKAHEIQKLDYSTTDNPFCGRIICGKCGKAYHKGTWNSTQEHLKRNIWQCSSRYKVRGVPGCGNKHVDDYKIRDSFVEAYNALVSNKEDYLKDIEEAEKFTNPLRRVVAKRFQAILDQAKIIENFDVELFFKVVEKIVISEEMRIEWHFLNGSKILL